MLTLIGELPSVQSFPEWHLSMQVPKLDSTEGTGTTTAYQMSLIPRRIDMKPQLRETSSHGGRAVRVSSNAS